MDIISTKRVSLKEVFKLLDTRNICNNSKTKWSINDKYFEYKARIDSCELFSVMLLIAKGDYETILISKLWIYSNSLQLFLFVLWIKGIS